MDTLFQNLVSLYKTDEGKHLFSRRIKEISKEKNLDYQLLCGRIKFFHIIIAEIRI